MLQPTKITFFHLLHLITIVFMTSGGLSFGKEYYGTYGGIAGGILGFFIGLIIGKLPDHFSQRHFFNIIANSTNEELWVIVKMPFWNFSQSFALLTLAGREQDVRCTIPRILTLLESEDELTRVYGWDALRLVFTDEYKLTSDYEPRNSAQACREKVQNLRDHLQIPNPENAASS